MLVLCALLFLRCGTIKVNYDYDRETDFSAYRTYGYYGDMQTGLSELDERRLLRVLDSVLPTKGLQLAEEADVLVNIGAEVYDKNPPNNVSVGIGGTGRNVGGGISLGIPTRGTGQGRAITFDFVDAKSETLVWSATSDASYTEKKTPIEREDQFKKIVVRVFSNFPPK